jgi:SAM-dependent methyltransferase
MDWNAWGGTFTADARSLAPYQGTPEEVAAALLRLAGLQPGETFVDLGAGDGRVLLHAVERFGAGAAVGWELDPAVHALALAHVDARLGAAGPLRARVTLHCGDAREAQLAQLAPHVVALYLLPEGNAALAPHLSAQLPAGCGTRVVAHGWPVPGWATDAEHATSMGTRLYLPHWRRPRVILLL